MSKYDVQIATELFYNKKAIIDRIENEIDREPEITECMFDATFGIYVWAINFDKYDSKRKRLDAFLTNNNIGELVRHAMVLVMLLDGGSDLITSIAGQLAGKIAGMEDRKQAVTMAGEILTLMCDFDCFDMDQRNHTIVDEESGEEYMTKSWFVQSPWELSTATSNHIKRGMYLPPMIIKPEILTTNTDSGYLTITNSSLILGKGNHHNGDICLDSLNRFNAIPLSINVEYIKSVELLMQDATVDMSEEAVAQYNKYMCDSMHVFAYLVKNDNKWYLEHKSDKRGRTYAQGYHCSTQSNAFRKGAVDLATKEIVNGEFK